MHTATLPCTLLQQSSNRLRHCSQISYRFRRTISKSAFYSVFNFVHKGLPARDILLLFLMWLDHLRPFPHNPCPSFIPQNRNIMPKSPLYTELNYDPKLHKHWLSSYNIWWQCGAQAWAGGDGHRYDSCHWHRLDLGSSSGYCLALRRGLEAVDTQLRSNMGPGTFLFVSLF